MALSGGCSSVSGVVTVLDHDAGDVPTTVDAVGRVVSVGDVVLVGGGGVPPRVGSVSSFGVRDGDPVVMVKISDGRVVYPLVATCLRHGDVDYCLEIVVVGSWTMVPVESVTVGDILVWHGGGMDMSVCQVGSVVVDSEHPVGVPPRVTVRGVWLHLFPGTEEGAVMAFRAGDVVACVGG